MNSVYPVVTRESLAKEQPTTLARKLETVSHCVKTDGIPENLWRSLSVLDKSRLTSKLREKPVITKKLNGFCCQTKKPAMSTTSHAWKKMKPVDRVLLLIDEYHELIAKFGLEHMEASCHDGDRPRNMSKTKWKKLNAAEKVQAVLDAATSTK